MLEIRENCCCCGGSNGKIVIIHASIRGNGEAPGIRVKPSALSSTLNSPVPWNSIMPVEVRRYNTMPLVNGRSNSTIMARHIAAAIMMRPNGKAQILTKFDKLSLQFNELNR